jgi:membrane-bound serine protease (ClpP class)
VVITVGLVLGLFLAFATKKVVEARRNPVHTGWEELVGAEGDVRVPVAPVGQVFVDGALWRAVAADGLDDEDSGRLGERGVRVRVDSIEGLTLAVSPLATEAEEK